MSDSIESGPENVPVAADFLHAPEPRRGFMVKASSLVIGGLVGLVPTAVGLATFLNPLRKSVQDQQRPSGSDSDGYYKVASLDAISEVPQPFTIIADRKDAWNTYPKSAIGTVFLQRAGAGTEELRAFNSTCPHAGCRVDFRSASKKYHCPCHNSTFDAQGTRDPKSPSARNLDDLAYRIVDGAVWVKYQDFKSGVAEKKAV